MTFRRILLNGLLVLLLVRCCTININHGKMVPEYIGVDPIAAPYVNEYLQLAKEHGIKFNNAVTVGFKDIDQGSTVGLSTLQISFREIDLDNRYWKIATDNGRRILIFHELSHSYCFREHDYGEDKEYKPTDKKGEGFFTDSCPISLMFPIVIPDKCFVTHRKDYINEMYQRCEPF